jgi:hypothetical protein
MTEGQDQDRAGDGDGDGAPIVPAPPWVVVS